jgi:hypothetical protein
MDASRRAHRNEIDVEEQARRRATRRPDTPDPRSVLKSAQERFRETARQLGEQPLRRDGE